jgi:hypothetical protein
MSENNFTPKTKEAVNERIRMSVRERLQEERTVSIEVPEEFNSLCARRGTTPENLFKGLMQDLLFVYTGPDDDPYEALFYQAASEYVSVAHGRVRIIQGGKYTERPAPRTFN